MNPSSTPSDRGPLPEEPNRDARPLKLPVAAAVAAWVTISLGFLGLRTLMQERPQFVGQPLRISQAELVQKAPALVARKLTDDLSVVRAIQPELSDIEFDMVGRRDHRGLKTVMDMSGTFRARYTITNAFEEAVFVLFKCPHPRSEGGSGHSLLAGGLRLQASGPGLSESAPDAWVWSGTVEPRSALTIEVTYQVAALKGLSYRIEESGGVPVSHLRTTFRRHDLESMRFEGGDGAIAAPSEVLVWERRDFLAPDFFAATVVESRNLFSSLAQLLEIGPLVCLLFLLAVTAVILTRQGLTAVQMLTISAGYAVYFPLVLYLSSRFSFAVALVIAVAIPGVLMVNYARWLLGPRLGLLGGPVALGLYQVFPTLAAFAGWNRGMVLLALGVVTLWVLVNLQNQALKRRTLATALIAVVLWPGRMNAAQVQVLLPAELSSSILVGRPEVTTPLVYFAPVHYQVRQAASHFDVEADLHFEVLRAGEAPTALFELPLHLQEGRVQSTNGELARLVTVTNRVRLLCQRPGSGSIRLVYRAPLEPHEGKRRARVPLVVGAAGQVRLESSRADCAILTGSVWGRSSAAGTNVYELGVAGEEALVVEWPETDGGSGAEVGRLGSARTEFYGIGLTRAQHLTVVNSDGSCTHFAEFELPGTSAEGFRLRLAPSARLISVSVNGAELTSPEVADQVCRVRLPGANGPRTAHRLSFRIAYPLVRLGFIGSLELALPEVFQTTGNLEWVVTLPAGFDLQVISSAMEVRNTAPDLSRFGDYGRVLKSHAPMYLTKDLAPPGPMSLHLKYRQHVRGFAEVRPADH